jgi:serine/threonine protein phosphatase PrpC
VDIVAGRASIVGAAATHVGKVREHNEDAHYFDADEGLFVVCDGMGGHAAGEVASGIAIQTIRAKWSSNDVQNAIDHWVAKGTPEAKKAMLAAIRNGALAAHAAIIAEAAADDEKSGMGTTLVGAMIVGNELVFAHAGDSRAYIVRDNIAMQLTEDHTLLSRLLAAGIDVDLSGEGSRFRSMLTNALGIGQECKVATFVVPLADGDRFLLCSDGISEYVPEPEVGTVLTSSPSPARAAQKLIDLALERGGGDNATAVVIRVLEAGETPQPVELRRKDDAAIQSCPLWDKVSPQQRLRALRIAISRDVGANERLPAHTLGERVTWIVVEGTLEHQGKMIGPGSLIYPESLIQGSTAPDRDSLAITRSDVRGLVLRADDFNELCDDDPELAELLHETLGKLVSKRGGQKTHSEEDVEQDVGRMPTLDPDRPQPAPRSRAETSELADPPPPIAPPLPITLPDDVIPLTKPKQAVPLPVDEAPVVARTKTPLGARQSKTEDPPPVAVKPPKPPPIPIPKLVNKPRTPTPPMVVIPPKLPGPVTRPPPTDVVDLGSELRADLGGDHAVPKRAPRVDARPTQPPPRMPTADDEPEIEEVVEMEADPPPLAPLSDDDSDEVEMTVVMGDGDEPTVLEEPTAENAPVQAPPADDDDEHEMTVTVDADEPPEKRPITANETVVVSGTIKIPTDKPRSKRMSDGWED